MITGRPIEMFERWVKHEPPYSYADAAGFLLHNGWFMGMTIINPAAEVITAETLITRHLRLSGTQAVLGLKAWASPGGQGHAVLWTGSEILDPGRNAKPASVVEDYLVEYILILGQVDRQPWMFKPYGEVDPP